MWLMPRFDCIHGVANNHQGDCERWTGNYVEEKEYYPSMIGGTEGKMKNICQHSKSHHELVTISVMAQQHNISTRLPYLMFRQYPREWKGWIHYILNLQTQFILLKNSNTVIQWPSLEVHVPARKKKLLEEIIKGKVHPSPEVEQKHSSTISLTSVLHGGKLSIPCTSHFTPGKDPVPTVQEDRWAPGLVWISVENIAPTGIPGPFSL